MRKIIELVRKAIKRGVCLFLPELKEMLLNSGPRIEIFKNVIAYRPYEISDVEIGEYTYISKNSSISRAKIGKFCSIGPNFLCGWGIHPLGGISTSPMFYSTRLQNGMTLSAVDKIEERKQITIGNDVFIGANVVVLDGVTIGDGAVIGAGAVVSKDIPDYSIAIGVPIRILRFRLREDQIEALKEIKWWDRDIDALREVEKYILDVDAYITRMKSR
jgi:virginiamycin A acetyltransferase